MLIIGTSLGVRMIVDAPGNGSGRDVYRWLLAVIRWVVSKRGDQETPSLAGNEWFRPLYPHDDPRPVIFEIGLLRTVKNSAADVATLLASVHKLDNGTWSEFGHGPSRGSLAELSSAKQYFGPVCLYAVQELHCKLCKVPCVANLTEEVMALEVFKLRLVVLMVLQRFVQPEEDLVSKWAVQRGIDLFLRPSSHGRNVFPRIRIDILCIGEHLGQVRLAEFVVRVALLDGIPPSAKAQ